MKHTYAFNMLKKARRSSTKHYYISFVNTIVKHKGLGKSDTQCFPVISRFRRSFVYKHYDHKKINL